MLDELDEYDSTIKGLNGALLTLIGIKEAVGKHEALRRLGDNGSFRDYSGTISDALLAYDYVEKALSRYPYDPAVVHLAGEARSVFDYMTSFFSGYVKFLLPDPVYA